MVYFMFLLRRPCRNLRETIKLKSRSFHKYSRNSEVETTWISLISWLHKTSNTGLHSTWLYIYCNGVRVVREHTIIGQWTSLSYVLLYHCHWSNNCHIMQYLHLILLVGNLPTLIYFAGRYFPVEGFSAEGILQPRQILILPFEIWKKKWVMIRSALNFWKWKSTLKEITFFTKEFCERNNL